MPAASPHDPQTGPRPTFEQSLAQVEQIVERLEDGQTGLEESMKLYQRAIGLLRECQTILEQAERQVSVLTQIDDQGQISTEPLYDTSTVPMEGSGDELQGPAGRATGPRRDPKADGGADMDASGRLF